MIKFIKKNIVLIIVCAVFIFFGAMSILKFLSETNKTNASWVNYYQTRCIEQNSQDFCNKGLEEYLSRPKRDTMSTLDYMNIYDSALQALSPLLIFTITSVYFSKYLKSGYLKNMVSRLGYKETIMRLYLKSLRYSLILPIYMIMKFIASYIISGHFDYTVGLNVYMFVGFSVEYAKHWIIFMLVYILNFWLHSIFWINLSIWNLKHNKHLVVSILISFVEFFMLEVILELMGTNFFMNSEFKYYLSLFYIWNFVNGHVTLVGGTIVSMILVMITSLMVYLAYKDKEKVLEGVSK